RGHGGCRSRSPKIGRDGPIILSSDDSRGIGLDGGEHDHRGRVGDSEGYFWDAAGAALQGRRTRMAREGYGVACFSYRVISARVASFSSCDRREISRNPLAASTSVSSGRPGIEKGIHSRPQSSEPFGPQKSSDKLSGAVHPPSPRETERH